MEGMNPQTNESCQDFAPLRPLGEKDELTFEMLKEIREKLCENATPLDEGEFSFLIFFNLWERIVCYFSPSYALKLYADRQIREWAKGRYQGVES